MRFKPKCLWKIDSPDAKHGSIFPHYFYNAFRYNIRQGIANLPSNNPLSWITVVVRNLETCIWNTCSVFFYGSWACVGAKRLLLMLKKANVPFCTNKWINNEFEKASLLVTIYLFKPCGPLLCLSTFVINLVHLSMEKYHPQGRFFCVVYLIITVSTPHYVRFQRSKKSVVNVFGY